VNILCNWLGHKFRHEEHGEKVAVQMFYGSSDNKIGEWDGLRVTKRCDRCGYEHADTFRIRASRTS
jgi:hypothetical protein